MDILSLDNSFRSKITDTIRVYKMVSTDKIKKVKITYMIIMFIGVALILIGTYTPGERVVFSILGAVCMVIVLILTVVTAKMQTHLQDLPNEIK